MVLASLKCRGWSAGVLSPGRWGGCVRLSALAVVGVRSPVRRPTAEAPPSDGRSPAVRRRPCPVGLQAVCPPALLLLGTGFLLPLLGWDGPDSEREHSRLQRTFSVSGVLG